MTEELVIVSERVDDIPLLVAHMIRMGLPEHLDTCFPTHGNWEGLSLGWVVTCWLAYILSEGNHRLGHIRVWAEERSKTLGICTGQDVRALDFSEDKLALVLRMLSDDERWVTFEETLNGHLLRVYTLPSDRVRIDTTTGSGYWRVTEEGLFAFGHSKGHRPDLSQVKVVLSTLDPLGMPVATEVVAGNRADTPLYIPAVERVREGLGKRRVLYIGDSKMGAKGTRGFIQAGGDYYLCPLSATQLPKEEMETYLEPVWRGEQELIDVHREAADGKRKQIAYGYERQVKMTAEVAGERITWTERRLVVRSLRQVEAAETRLRKRIKEAQAAVEEALRRKGWRVYATNTPAARLSLAQAILAYRGQYIIERGYSRLKGRPLSLAPMYLERDDHATGLIRLLSIGLRVLTLLEFVVRRRLAEKGAELSGLYAGNPKRATARPTAERLLEAFEGLTLTQIREPHRPVVCHLTPLSDLQRQILNLLGFTPDVYTRLYVHSREPP